MDSMDHNTRQLCTLPLPAKMQQQSLWIFPKLANLTAIQQHFSTIILNVFLLQSPAQGEALDEKTELLLKRLKITPPRHANATDTSSLPRCAMQRDPAGPSPS
jgi:hypothetical protein